MALCEMPLIDELIGAFDRGLRTVTGVSRSNAAIPDDVAGESDAPATPAQRRKSAGLMRVNHAGEVCAQALYDGQALTARKPEIKAALESAAREEQAHLGWCRQRLHELGARPSMLDPLFYCASYATGAVTGLLGDRVSLGFVAATEDQVVEHLDRHLEQLDDDDRSRDILQRMRTDEARHGTNALRAGGAPFPPPVKKAMTMASKLMTETTFRI